MTRSEAECACSQDHVFTVINGVLKQRDTSETIEFFCMVYGTQVFNFDIIIDVLDEPTGWAGFKKNIEKLPVKECHDRVGSNRAGPGRFIMDIEYTIKKKHFLFHKPYRKKKPTVFEKLRCLKTRVWLWKQAVECKLVPHRSTLLVLLSNNGKNCFSDEFQTLKNRLRLFSSKSLHRRPSY